jgi:serine/threonine-protein kinase
VNTIRSDAPVALDAEEAARGRVGEVFGDRWRLDGVLGTGGMAVVYAATHRNGARVAIKVPLGSEPELTSRFVKEGWIGNRVDHPGVVKALDEGVTPDGLPFIVMERLSGETFAERIEREGRIAPAEVARIVAEVCDVLAAAHAAGIVHRDVKPSNVFLTSDGRVKLLDFGIAREIARTGQTIVGLVLGTPGFLAPEQATGDSVGPRTDIWAAGALAFAALTGTTLHGGESPMEKLAAAMIDAPPVRTLAPDIPASLAAVLDRALLFDPQARFASALEMRDALAHARIAAPTTPRAPARSRRGVLVAVVSVLAAWAVVAGAAKLALEDDGANTVHGAPLVSAPAALPDPSMSASASASAIAPAPLASVTSSAERRPAQQRGAPRRVDPMVDRF